jgi:dihydroflavonol-4-reductase
MKKVIVTGANGFLGSNLCKKLIDRGYEVSVIVRKNSDVSELKGLNLNYFYGDVTDINSLKEAFKHHDYVLHLAGLISYKKYDREKMHLINVVGTENVIHACISASIEKLLHLSSVVTIGSSFMPHIQNEQSEYTIKNLDLGYFETKLEAEKKVMAASQLKSLFTVCVNPSTIYGFADAKKGSRSNQIKVAQGKLPFYTAGGVNVVSVDDVTDGIILALEKGSNGERYILANENITIKELFQMIAKSAGKPAPEKYLPTFLLHIAGWIGDRIKKGLSSENAYTASMYHWFDNSKAKRELGFAPKKSAQQAIDDSVSWMKQNGYLG